MGESSTDRLQDAKWKDLPSRHKGQRSVIQWSKELQVQEGACQDAGCTESGCGRVGRKANQAQIQAWGPRLAKQTRIVGYLDRQGNSWLGEHGLQK